MVFEKVNGYNLRVFVICLNFEIIDSFYDFPTNIMYYYFIVSNFSRINKTTMHNMRRKIEQ